MKLIGQRTAGARLAKYGLTMDRDSIEPLMKQHGLQA